MGTIRDWGWVALGGGMWGGMMLIWYRHGRTGRVKTDRSLLIAEVLMWMFGGLWFGIMLAFKGRAFHAPIIWMTVVAIAGALFFGRKSALERLKIMRGEGTKLGASNR